MPSQVTEGYLSTDPNESAFANWTKFFIPYCDGAIHQGFSIKPIHYKEAKLFFRGGALTRSHFNWINSKYSLTEANQIVLTGMSAGGVAVNSWNNYLRKLSGDPSKVYTISDSSIFLDVKAFNGEYIFYHSNFKIFSKSQIVMRKVHCCNVTKSFQENSGGVS